MALPNIHPSNGLSSLQKRLRPSNEPSVDLSNEQKTFTDPAYVNDAGTFVAVAGGRRGYQFKSRIIRPDSFGIYTPLNDEEAVYLNQLVTDGIMAVASVAVPYEDQ